MFPWNTDIYLWLGKGLISNYSLWLSAILGLFFLAAQLGLFFLLGFKIFSYATTRDGKDYGYQPLSSR